MTAFPKTRAAAGYAARHGPGELARARATFLLARLGACEDFLPGGDGDVTADLRDLVLAARDLAGPAWLQASGDDRPGGARRDHLPGPVSPLRPAWRHRPPRTLAEALQALPAAPGPARPGGTARPGPVRR